MQRKAIICLLVVIITTTLLPACVPVEYYPDEGEWFCEALELQLAFGDKGNCFVVINGEKVECACGSDRGSEYISVGCQESDCEYYDLGEEIFGATFVALDDEKLVVAEVATGREYTFIRVN